MPATISKRFDDTDDEGRTIAVTVEVTMPAPVVLPAVQPMRAGVTVDPKDLAVGRHNRYPGLRHCRFFWSPGDGLPVLADKRLAQFQQGRKDGEPARIPHVSWKDWDSLPVVRAGVNALLDSLTAPAAPAPVDEPLLVLTWMHEGDAKNVDPATYRRNWWDLSGIVGEHPNGALVQLVPIQTLQWTESMKDGKGKGDLSRYYVGLGQPGIDCYNDGWLPTYPDPHRFLETPLRLADRAGQAPCLPELGISKLAYDPTGQRRADLLLQIAGILRSEGCVMVNYWDDLGTGGTDFRLDDKPSADAWRAVVAGTF